jgi:hypothetical protein
MTDKYYTLSVWKVRPGVEEEFKAAWRDLAKIFTELADPPLTEILLQSIGDPLLFYSFGPWESHDAVIAMRRDPAAMNEIKRVTELCSEVMPGTFKMIDEIES